MTLRLILTRHAKSAWGDPVMDDHERPLNNRGRLSALAVGQWLNARGYVPGEALVSTSERTRQTWQLIAEAFSPAPKARFRPDLYHAEPEQLLEALREATAPVVMMVGHNPGVAYFAQALAGKPPADARFARYPTAATTVFEFDLHNWQDLRWRMGRIADFVFARDLI